MAEAKKLVWIQLAQTGTFKGHPQGPFHLDVSTFDSIVKNFKRDGLPIAIDAEHASEMPPNSGSIPAEGAPAMGWIHSLDNRGQNGLWGQVEWLEPARSYIKEGRYKFLSPAIRFKSKDRRTGEQTGPRLSSAAITNQPFLPDMKPLTASARAALADGESVHVMSLALAEELADANETATTMSLGTRCYAAHEYMPQIKSALGMHELSNAMECSDRLAQLRGHLESVGGDHTQKPEGVDLAKYCMPLRSMANCPMGATWDDVFDTVQDMIDAAIDEHVIEDHEEGPNMSTQEPSAPAVALTSAEPAAPTAAPLPLGTETPAEPAPQPAAPAESAEPAAPAAVLASSAEPVIATEPPPPAAPAAAPATPTIPEAAPAPAPTEVTNMANPATPENADVTLLSLKLQTAESELEQLRAENARLLTWKETREEADLAAEVSVAYDTYAVKKGLKPQNKEAMLKLLRADPQSFRELYPEVPVARRHLLQTIAATERQATAPTAAPRVPADAPAPVQPAPIRMTVRQLARQIQVKRNCPLGVAQQEAERMLKEERLRQQRAG